MYCKGIKCCHGKGLTFSLTLSWFQIILTLREFHVSSPFSFFISKVIYLGQYPLCLFIAFYFFFHKVFPIEKLRTKHSCAIEKKTKKKSTNVATAKAGFLEYDSEYKPHPYIVFIFVSCPLLLSQVDGNLIKSLLTWQHSLPASPRCHLHGGTGALWNFSQPPAS